MRKNMRSKVVAASPTEDLSQISSHPKEGSGQGSRRVCGPNGQEDGQPRTSLPLTLNFQEIWGKCHNECESQFFHFSLIFWKCSNTLGIVYFITLLLQSLTHNQSRFTLTPSNFFPNWFIWKLGLDLTPSKSLPSFINSLNATWKDKGCCSVVFNSLRPYGNHCYV